MQGNGREERQQMLWKAMRAVSEVSPKFRQTH
jgi:hypothetical protein